MKAFRELELMILQYIYIFGNENLFGNEYKKEIWYTYWYKRGFVSCAATQRHFKIFDSK
jgi:hypothetical protein